jgi:hypothetical protein
MDSYRRLQSIVAALSAAVAGAAVGYMLGRSRSAPAPAPEFIPARVCDRADTSGGALRDPGSPGRVCH